MYSSYTSLKDSIQKEIENQKSVLNKFPEHISRPITQSCSKYLAQFTSFQLVFKSDNTKSDTEVVNLINAENLEKLNILQLETPEQVNWTLENLMYGLTLTHDYQDTIKDCWNIYHDWLSVLLDESKLFLPQPIRDDPIHYSKKMLWHLYHLFVPRKDQQPPTKHIMMCHGVLVLSEAIAKDSKLLERDLWEDFLKFFLAINNAVLSPPFTKDDFGEILSSRIVATLFEIWLIACNKVFPSASLWKTFQELCSNWRHHIPLVIEWNRVCYALTNRLLELTWWSESSQLNQTQKNLVINDTNVSYDIQTIIGQMSIETVTQAWFRFLHIIGRPIEFCDLNTISKLLEMTRLSSNKINTEVQSLSQVTQSCLKRMPVIFLEFLKGVSRIIDLFLGLNLNQFYTKNQSLTDLNQTKTRSKTFLQNLETLGLKLNTYKHNRPSVNSLLSLFGQWLFESASFNLIQKEFILGQAESIGLLCKIFCSVKTNEKINHDYLSRFYSLLAHGLKVPSNFGEMNSQCEYESGELLASILVNGCNLFKLDLDGINMLLIPILNAINSVFKLKYVLKEEKPEPGSNTTSKQKEIVRSTFLIGSTTISLIDLKKYSILIFSSLLSLPNHFNSLALNDPYVQNLNFFQLRSKILEIYLAGMQNELDTSNLQFLFGCGKLIIGEWTLDEVLNKNNLDKKEKAIYCYNQVVSLICAPLKMNHSTLQNHSFALSIFDSLTSIAAGDLLNEEESICKLSISLILHYVRSQIKRRSREHTREMHSVIVAAYNCLITLLITKPSLLKDKSCLQTVTNCIEIGISGSSSYPDQKSAEQPALMKQEKELKPASLRVKEAAEAVLCFLMEQTSFPFMNQIENCSDLTRLQLDEKSILDLTLNHDSKWKYYALDGGLILAVLEKPLLKTNISNICPQVTVLLRGPFGRQAWSLNLRQSAFNKIENVVEVKYNLNQDIRQNQVYRLNKIKEFESDSGEEMNNSSPKCETSIPTLIDVAQKCFKNLPKFKKLKQDQIEFEKLSIERINQENSSIKINTSIDQSLNIKNCNDFSTTSRMLLSHLGFCSLESSTKIVKDDLAEILCLDSTDHSFNDQLSNLDYLPTRTFSTCSIFYIKKGQTSLKSILDNITSDLQLDDNFYMFIKSLGSILDVSSQQQNLSLNINKRLSLPNSNEDFKRRLNKINGIENCIYWSDLSSEIVFSLPNGNKCDTSTLSDDNQFKAKFQHLPNDLKVLIIWLEQVQDADLIPIDELVQESFLNDPYFNAQQSQSQSQQQQSFYINKPKEIIILFIQPLKNRLNRIITWSNFNKKNFYTMPLIDGMVVSSRMLSSMIRQTVLNIFRRKRLEIDDYQPPHVKRKNKISEIIKKYQSKKSEPDLFTSFLMGH